MEPQPGAASPLAFRPRRARNPPILTMVKEAVQLLNETKGTSVTAIRRYILHTYPSIDPVRLKYTLKQALTKGLKSGVLVQPPHSSLHVGRYKLAENEAKQQQVHEEEPMEGEEDPMEGEAAPSDQKMDVKKPKVKRPKEGKKGAKGKAKPRAKAGDSAEEKAAPGRQPKATTSKDSTQTTVKSKEKSSKEGDPEKLSDPGTSQAEATAAPKKAAAKGAKKGHGPDQPESEDQAETPAAKKAKVPVAVKKSKARAKSSTGKTGEGAAKPEGKEETLKCKEMRKAARK